MGANSAQVMIIGNKMDLVEGREVSYDEAVELARCYGVDYMECSAKNGQNVEAVFGHLAKKMKAKFIDELTEDPKKPEPLELPAAKTPKERCCANT